MAGSKPDRHALQRPQASQHQAGANEQDDGERHLDDDQRVAETLAAGAARDALCPVLQRIGEVDAQRLERRCEAEDHAGQQRDTGGEEENPEIDCGAGDARDARRVPPGHELHAQVRQAEPGDGADAREDQALGQQLPQHAKTPGAERGTKGNLALARFGPRQQQVGDVGAGDEQQEADRTEEQPDRAAHRADDFIGQRQRHRVELHLHRVEAFGRHRAGDAMQFVGGLRHRRAGREPRRGEQPVTAVVGRVRIHLERDPQLARLGILEIRRQREPRRHHADDLVALAVDQDAAADDRRIRRVAAVPHPESENDHPRTAWQVFLGRERTADERGRTEGRKEVCGYGGRV